ncbi:unnamed protein product [Prunus armeniaca]|uniref:Uncharacterized protein n=1 Tax=Prunus armeniaca TaxID=36596 RepID=A0A6J5UIQ6_PRUAR|nr:unnamed protein product [Prunus armeniaca]
MKFKILSTRLWTVGEDKDLIEAVERYGTHRWKAVARFLGTKTRRECQSRWVNWLDPQIRRDEWSEMEDAKLRELSRIMSAQWQTISEIFNGTPSSLKTHSRRYVIRSSTSSFTKKAGPPQRICGEHTTNSQLKSGEKKVFLQRSTPRSKIDLDFDNSFSNLNKQEKAAMKEKEKDKAVVKENENEKVATKEKENEKVAAAAVEEKEKTAAVKEEEKTAAVKDKEKAVDMK